MGSTSLTAAPKADALMFCHIYADLITLEKSNDLDKSVNDMSKHYLEIKVFLEEVYLFIYWLKGIL